MTNGETRCTSFNSISKLRLTVYGQHRLITWLYGDLDLQRLVIALSASLHLVCGMTCLLMSFLHCLCLFSKKTLKNAFVSPVITGRCRRQLCRYCFYSRADFEVFRPAGATRCTDQGQDWQGGADRGSAPPCQIWPWSVQGWGFTAPKTEKWNFTNIIAPKGRVPCTNFTKFIGFMRVLSLHNFAKFRCFISINGEIINNLPRLGRFQPNFRRPLAAKLWREPKMFQT